MHLLQAILKTLLGFCYIFMLEVQKNHNHQVEYSTGGYGFHQRINLARLRLRRLLRQQSLILLFRYLHLLLGE